MNNIGNKVSFSGLLACTLVSLARIAMYFTEVLFYDGNVIKNYSLFSILFAVCLAVTAVGYVLKFLGEKEVFDIIAVVTLVVSVVFCVSSQPFNIYHGLKGLLSLNMNGEVIKIVLENLFLLGLTAYFFKKGNKKHGKILIFAFAYLSVGQIALNALFLDGGADLGYLYFTEMYNSIVMLVTLLFTSLTIINDN